jgi:hypothetical protein
MTSTNFRMGKLFYVALFVALVVCIVFVKLHYTNNDEQKFAGITEQARLTNVQPSGDGATVIKTMGPDVKTAEKKNISVPDVVTLAGTPAEAELLTKWEESKGRYSAESLAEYYSYDYETLIRLADGGDLKAMMALVDYYLSEKNTDPANGVENAIRISIKAAVYGSTAALEGYSELVGAGPDSTPEQIIEMLAWKDVAALRGDMFPNQIAIGDIERLKFTLNEESAGKIRQRSEEIYAELQQIRSSLGLGDFDNSQSPEAIKFFSHLENYMDKYNK